MTALPADTFAPEETARLRTQLLRLRRPLPRRDGPGRAMSGATPEALLTALLTEIDETILPRRLTGVLGSGRTLSLDVSGRRVVRLHSADRTGFSTADDAAAQIAPVIAGFLDGATNLRLIITRDLAEGVSSAIGCDADLLARHLGLTAWRDSGTRGERDIVAVLNRYATAWVRLASPGHNVAQGGDPVSAGELTALSRRMADDLDPLLGAALGGRRTQGYLYQAGPEGAGGVLFLRKSGQITLARLTDTAWPQVAARIESCFDQD